MFSQVPDVQRAHIKLDKCVCVCVQFPNILSFDMESFKSLIHLPGIYS